MKKALPWATGLILVSVIALALVSTAASARSYGYRHHHLVYHGFGYTSRPGIVKILGN